MLSKSDHAFMQMAIRLAKRGLGATRPNPAVGAVVVRQGTVVGKGWHKRAGTPHAEIHALSQAGERAKGATLYVTLEPCNHQGRTPPCTHAILKAGISEVVIGALDPNPNVEGGGADFLRSKGVKVRTGCHERQCMELVAPFAKHLKKGIPWIISKVALSLDGRTATRTGHSKWITGEKARAYGHRVRHECDAILVGSGTVLADNPSLTCRIKGGKGRDPARIILDSTLKTPVSSKVVKQASVSLEEWLREPTMQKAPTVIVGAKDKAPFKKVQELESKGAKVLLIPEAPGGGVDLKFLLKRLGALGIQSILVEGGATVHGSFWDQGLVDQALFFYGPVVIGGSEAQPAIAGHGAERLDVAFRLRWTRRVALGDDLLVKGLVTDLYDLWQFKSA